MSLSRVRPAAYPAGFAGLDARTVANRAAAIASGLAEHIVGPERVVPDVAAGAPRRVLLLAGDHGGLLLPADADDAFTGLPGAILGGAVVVRSKARFDGIEFRAQDATTALVTLRAAARAVFTNCRFIRNTQDTGNWVAMDAGASASFVGCQFLGVTGAGDVVNNAGVALDAGIVGCVNLTTRAHVNVTTIFEVT